MRPDVIVIASIGLQNPTKVCLAQDDEMIHALAPDRPDQSFGKAILPKRGRRGGLVADAHGAQSARDEAAVDPIADEKARRSIPGECLGYLTCYPLSSRVCCDVDPDQISAV